MYQRFQHTLMCGLILVMMAICLQMHICSGTLPCDSLTYMDDHYYCARVIHGIRTRSECKGLCEAQAGFLPVISSQQLNEFLLNLVVKESLVEVWIGLEEFPTTWRWQQDQNEVEYQGCYVDNTEKPDMAEVTSLDNLTPNMCREHCATGAYSYYGLQEGTQCWCGDSFGSYGMSYLCSTPCPGQPTERCGGELVNSVYARYGGFDAWAEGQPNNHGQYQSCVVVDDEYDYIWNDVSCTESHAAICKINVNETQCTSTDSRYYLDLNGCVQIVTSPATYSIANYDCINMGGHLASVTSPEEWDELRYLVVNMTSGNLSFWLGLAKRHWRWHSGAYLEYSAWNGGRPNGANQHCATLGDQGSWDDVDCGVKYGCICQLDNATVIETYVSTDHPIVDDTLVPIFPTTPTPASGFLEEYTQWVILAGGVAFAIILIIIIICQVRLCFVKKKKKRTTVKENQFDFLFGIDVGSVEATSGNGHQNHDDTKRDTKTPVDDFTIKSTTPTNTDDKVTIDSLHSGGKMVIENDLTASYINLTNSYSKVNGIAANK